MKLIGQLNVRVIFNVKFNSGGHNCYSLKEINQTKFRKYHKIHGYTGLVHGKVDEYIRVISLIPQK